MAKIYSIDWSYTNENEILTCGQDKQVKVIKKKKKKKRLIIIIIINN